MRVHNDYTPREYAYCKTIDLIRLMHQGEFGVFDYLVPSERKELQKQFAKLHNRLLTDKGLAAMNIDPLPL